MDRFEVVVFRLGADGETRTVGRTDDAAAVAGALDAIGRELRELRGTFPDPPSTPIRALRPGAGEGERRP